MTLSTFHSTAYVIDGFGSSAGDRQQVRHHAVLVIEGDGNSSNQLIARESAARVIEGVPVAADIALATIGAFVIETGHHNPNVISLTASNAVSISGRPRGDIISAGDFAVHIITTEE